jgi:hypothetical protein
MQGDLARIHSVDDVWISVVGELRFRRLDPITDDEVADLLEAVSRRVIRPISAAGNSHEFLP